MEEQYILGFDELFEDGCICCGLPEDGTLTIEDVDNIMQNYLEQI